MNIVEVVPRVLVFFHKTSVVSFVDFLALVVHH